MSDEIIEIPDTDEDKELRLKVNQAEEAERDALIAQYEEKVIESKVTEEAEDCFPAIRGIDFLNRPEVPVTAYIPDFIYAGCLNATIGDAKAGKSTLEWAKVISLLTGAPFLGKPCTPGRVLYVSEQSEVSFRHQLKNRCPEPWYKLILSHPNFYMLLPEDHKIKIGGGIINATNWDQRIMVWQEAVKRVKPSVFILDTFGAYADLSENGENDNAAINSRLFDLKSLRTISPAIAIDVMHHTTKRGKSSARKKYLDLSACRGASAFVGALDHAVILNKLDTRGNDISRTRYIHIEGRMIEERKFAISWLPAGEYIEIPDSSDEEIPDKGDMQARIAALVAEEPGLTDCTIMRFIDALADRGLTGVSYRQARKFLK